MGPKIPSRIFASSLCDLCVKNWLILMSPRTSPTIFPVKETFLPLPENHLAFSAVREFSEMAAKPLRRGRLVYLWGPSGTGKSLLVRELNRLEHAKSERSVSATLTASEWSAQLAEASQHQTLDQFSEQHRSLELLICEDVTAISGRRESQTQLSFAIDEILATGGRVLITSTLPAGNLPRFSRRLINRFHGGTTISISLPNLMSRVKLLQHFAAARQIALPLPIAETLAEALPVSPRELLASLIQLETLARQQDVPISPALVARHLHFEESPQPLTLSEVAKSVARQFGVTVSALRGKTRSHGIVLPRQCGMFLARELTDQSLLAIAQFFGRGHHSTVLHACKRMESALSSEPALRQHLAQIRTALGVHPLTNSCG